MIILRKPRLLILPSAHQVLNGGSVFCPHSHTSRNATASVGSFIYLLSRPRMATHRPRSTSLPPRLYDHPTTLPYDYCPLFDPRAIRLLFVESQSHHSARYFITGRLETVKLDEYERKYVALSYTWGPAIRNEFSAPGDASRITPSYELLIETPTKPRPKHDCHLPGILRDRPDFTVGYASLKLAPNLSDYFRHRAEWHIQEGVPVWIDAVCINQQDSAEVADQILLQADIYTLAMQTNVWLGACQKDLDVFEWWQNTVYHTLAQQGSRRRQSPYVLDLTFKTGDHLDAEFWLQNFGLAPLDGLSWHDCWRSYVDFFLARRWFSRLWTIQEVMLAQKVYMLCGPKSFDFAEVLRLDRWLLSSFFRTKPSHDTKGSPSEPVWPRWNPGYIFEIIRTRINHVQLQGTSSDATDGVSSVRLSYLLGILQCARGQETTFPRDKVLGLLGVATRFVPKNKVQLLVRNLGGTDRDVFVSFARYYIHRQCLDILAYAGYRHGLSDSSWPSWVPNWDDVSQSGFYDFPASTEDSSPPTRDMKNPQTSPEPASHSELDKCIPRVVGETLLLYGTRIGVVRESYAKDQWTRHFGSLLKLLGPMYAFTGEPVHEALLRTIFRAANGDSSAAQRIGIQEIQQFLLYIRTKLVYNGMADPSSVGDLEDVLSSEPTMHTHLSSVIYEALSEIQRATQEQASSTSPGYSNAEATTQHGGTVNQSFSIELEVMQKIFNVFVTAEGVLGNGSKSIKPGDEIWMVQKCPVPLILEPGPDGNFRLISTAYVHGVKYGEIFRSKVPEDLVEVQVI